MSRFTAEDFAQANLATKDWFDVARRADPHLTHQWHVYGSRQGYFSDEEMARDGWEPVVESRITDHTLRRVEERAERKRQKLIAHIASVEAAVRDRNRTIEELRHDLAVAQKERERLAHDLRRSLGRPKGDTAITLDGLEAAWEAAEVPTEDDPIREGDEIICLMGTGGYLLRRASAHEHGRVPLPSVRVLSRAPQSDPWEELEDILRAIDWQAAPEHTAKELHNRGVRVIKNGEETA